jgi:hypothetical protein
MDEIGATGVTSMSIKFAFQQAFTNGWHTVQATTFTYKFAGSKNNASHVLAVPGSASSIRTYNFNANQDSHNYIFRVNASFTWRGPGGQIGHGLVTSGCVA